MCREEKNLPVNAEYNSMHFQIIYQDLLVIFVPELHWIILVNMFNLTGALLIVHFIHINFISSIFTVKKYAYNY